MRRWGFSAFDKHWHAVDEQVGVVTAICGRVLPAETSLGETFEGTWCEACATHQLAAVPLSLFSREQLFPSPTSSPSM
ncbi:MAG: hypothetical protein ACRDRU_28205 [Pseudonocardiaceae bacterium]